MDTSSSSDEPSPPPSDLDSEASSEHPQEGVRQQGRAAKRKRYFSGKSRKVYQLRRELDKSLDSTMLPGVRSSCAPALEQIAEGFKQLKHHGTELKKRKCRLPYPKKPNSDHYRNLQMQNEWMRGNLFDSMGNYLFCHECIVKGPQCEPTTPL